MRLIDADALIDDLMERYCKECDKRKGIKNGKWQIIYEIGEAPCRACEVDDVKAELEEAPTAQERKKGKWIRLDEYPDDESLKCSECGVVLEDWVMGAFFNYCPNCGADMRGEEDVGN